MFSMRKREIFQQSDSSHSYAWTSVVIPGPRHTVKEKYRNKATFTLSQLETEVDYQVSLITSSSSHSSSHFIISGPGAG